MAFWASAGREEPPRRLEAEAGRRDLGPERVWIFRPGETRTW